ncbi:MAG: translation initiation factor IF-2 [Planctomycetes bacterium]|nr:translation initiation factor IF-2 [Planctomycetota bacterium]
MQNRIFELAYELGAKSVDIIKIARGLGLKAEDHLSQVSDMHVLHIRTAYRVKQGLIKPAAPKPQVGKDGAQKEKKKEERHGQKTDKKEQVSPREEETRKATKSFKEKLLKSRGSPMTLQEQRQAAMQKQVQSTPRAEEKAKGPKQKQVKELKAGTRTLPAIPIEREKAYEVELPVTVKEFSQLVGIKVPDIIRKLFSHGKAARINDVLDEDEVGLIAMDFGKEVKFKRPKDLEEELADELDAEEDESQLVTRPPVIAFLGHVDHGKTSLIDAIRHANVASGEAGGITQHFSAYWVNTTKGSVVILDTPGHEAFTSMRARGARTTDIVILVVAADDGVKPQTKEAIAHAKEAGVPIVVALNKIDKPEANLDRAKSELSQNGLVPADWGGDIECIPVSAHTKEGLDLLLDTILTEAELHNFRANPNRPAQGFVLEAERDVERGIVARILVTNGTIHKGDIILAGTTSGRVRALINDLGESVESAPPSSPVEVLGLGNVPFAGDKFFVLDSLERAATLASKRSDRKKKELLASEKRSMLESFAALGKEELKIIIKADVQGNIETLRGAIEELEVREVAVKIIYAAVGGITEADVNLADASGAVIFGFHTVAGQRARQLAREHSVEIRTYKIIYEMISDIKLAIAGKLKPREVEKVTGEAEVLQVIKIPKAGNVAGSKVVSGIIERSSLIRVVREGIVVVDDRGIDSLKRFKDDVREVREGLECGIKIHGFDQLRPRDRIQAYKREKIDRVYEDAL